MDYNKFKAETGINGTDIVKCLSEKYPNFSKIQQCMICAPEKYGIRLLPEADKKLQKTFGTYTTAKTTKRKKTKRINARLDEETYKKFIKMVELYGYRSIQDAVEEIIKKNV